LVAALWVAPARAVGGDPVVGGVSPNSGGGCGGETVAITGLNFTGATGVSFYPVGGGSPTPANGFTVNSDTRITAVVPPLLGGYGSATYDVRVAVGSALTAPNSSDRYTASEAQQAAAVWNVVPSQGFQGDQVTIVGSGFCQANHVSVGGDGACIQFNPAGYCDTPDGNANFQVLDDNTIVAQVPHQAQNLAPGLPFGTVDVEVWTLWFDQDPTTGQYTVPDQQRSAPNPGDRFTYVSPPHLTGVSPGHGPVTGGSAVQITGTGLTGATEVYFGDVKATSFTVNGDSSISAVAPPSLGLEPGPIEIAVVGPGPKQYDTSNGWQYIYDPIPPEVDGIDPGGGSTYGGDTVHIVGSGFQQPGNDVSSVKFGSTEAPSFTVVDDSHITAVSPPHAHGGEQVDITVTSPLGTSKLSIWDLFFYGPGPVVTSVAPRTGPTSGGNIVTIRGADFLPSSVVRFQSEGGTLPVAQSASVHTPTPTVALTKTFVSSGILRVVAPPHAAGYVDVIVTNSDPRNPGSSPLSSLDAYTYALTLSAPRVAPWLASQTYSSSSHRGGATLLGSGGMNVALRPVKPGTATLDWWCKACGARNHPVLIGHGLQRFNGKTAGILKLRLTPAGRRLLNLRRALHLEAKATFTPVGLTSVRANRMFSLR
jgi:hypothetical protein